MTFLPSGKEDRFKLLNGDARQFDDSSLSARTNSDTWVKKEE
jgi:hypothetical protein